MWGFCHRNVVSHPGRATGSIASGSWARYAMCCTSTTTGTGIPTCPGGTVTRTAMAQFLLDMETGRFLDFNASSMQEVLARDPVLSAEYEAIPARKREGGGPVLLPPPLQRPPPVVLPALGAFTHVAAQGAA